MGYGVDVIKIFKPCEKKVDKQIHYWRKLALWMVGVGVIPGHIIHTFFTKTGILYRFGVAMCHIKGHKQLISKYKTDLRREPDSKKIRKTLELALKRQKQWQDEAKKLDLKINQKLSKLDKNSKSYKFLKSNYDSFKRL